MKKKILTHANALIVMLLSALGFGACESMQKYGVPPDGPEVLYGPMPDYGVPTPEQVQEVPSSSIVEEAE